MSLDKYIKHVDLRLLQIWEIAKGRIRNIFVGHQQKIYSLDFSGDGGLIISGSGDNAIRIWDMYDMSSKILTISNSDGSDFSGVTWVTISPDGALVAAGYLDTTVCIWDIATGALLERLQGHKDFVYSVAFTSDGKGLVSGSWDNSLKYWDVSVLAAGSAKSKPKNAIPTPPLSGPSSSSDRSVVRCTMDFLGHKVGMNDLRNDPTLILYSTGLRSVRLCDT